MGAEAYRGDHRHSLYYSHGNVCKRHCWRILVLPLGHSNSSITVKCVFVSVFLLHSHGHPATFVSILWGSHDVCYHPVESCNICFHPVGLPWNLWRSRRPYPTLLFIPFVEESYFFLHIVNTHLISLVTL